MGNPLALRQREEQRHQELLEQQQERQEMESQAESLPIPAAPSCECQNYRMVPPSYKLVYNPDELVRYIYHYP